MSASLCLNSIALLFKRLGAAITFMNVSNHKELNTHFLQKKKKNITQGLSQCNWVNAHMTRHLLKVCPSIDHPGHTEDIFCSLNDLMCFIRNCCVQCRLSEKCKESKKKTHAVYGNYLAGGQNCVLRYNYWKLWHKRLYPG